MNIGPLVGRVFANGPEDPDRVIPKTQKMVLDTPLLNTQHYKVRVKEKVEQSRERIRTLPYISVQSVLKMEPSGLASTKVTNNFINIFVQMHFVKLNL